MTDQNTLSARWPEFVGLAWADDDFRRQLLSDPARQLEAFGIDLTVAGAIRIVEQADGETVLVMPRKPAGLQATGVRQSTHQGAYSTCENKGTYSTCENKGSYSTCEKITYSTCENK